MEFFTYFSEVLSVSNLTILILATGAGLVLGALPGLSPTMAVALLIPFTFQMDATSGLI
ncbi:MAG TPA: C4-dicarboxylate ABC transporter permease, partial [Oceanospirillaceae bacterium]|nr:C4-dicarboxylate ABC transporter permease [Oceanospirillaceae bacterium]